MDWAKLWLHVRNNNCVAIIGAGASRPHIPPAKELAAALLDIERVETGNADPFIDPASRAPWTDVEKRTVEDLSAVAQYLAVVHKDGKYPKYRIAEIVKRHCENPQLQPGDPHRALAALNLPIYVTTNYDNRMKLALQLQNKTVETAICRWNDELSFLETSSDDGEYAPTREHPVVFHLHGQMEIPESIVASEDDFLDFLAEIAKQKHQDLVSDSTRPGATHPMLPFAIQRALAKNLLLFVGYGIADTNFRVVLRGLKTSLRSSGVTSITVQYGGEHRDEMKAYLEQYFRWMLDLDVFWGSSDEFAKELLGKLSSSHV